MGPSSGCAAGRRRRRTRAAAPEDAEDIIDEEFNVTVFFIALIPLLWASLGQSTHFDSTGLSFVATYGKLLVALRDLSSLQQRTVLYDICVRRVPLPCSVEHSPSSLVPSTHRHMLDGASHVGFRASIMLIVISASV